MHKVSDADFPEDTTTTLSNGAHFAETSQCLRDPVVRFIYV